MLQPIYTIENTRFAYQLRWGVTIYWREMIEEQIWGEPLCEALESDGIRILSCRKLSDSATQFVLSTQAPIAPKQVIQRLKGRLQYAVREHSPKALKQHYALRSFGTQEREIIENYVFGQIGHHQMATDRAQRIFEDLCYINESIDLSSPQKTTHSLYWYNLHIVLVNSMRWCDVNESRLRRVQRALLLSGQRHGWRISRLSILADHVHIALGCNLTDSPSNVVLSMMNNIAWVYGMKPMLQFSAYAATFGEYDHRAIK